MQDLRLLGELQFGVYERRSSPEPGDAPDTVDAIMSEQQANVNHEAVHVPLRRNPFRDSEEEDVFFLIFVKSSHKTSHLLTLDSRQRNGIRECTRSPRLSELDAQPKT